MARCERCIHHRIPGLAGDRPYRARRVSRHSRIRSICWRRARSARGFPPDAAPHPAERRGPIIVNATLLVGINIITRIAQLLWIRPPKAHFNLGYHARPIAGILFTAPLMLYVPGFAILITVLCFNLMGDGLRDALDPYMTER